MVLGDFANTIATGIAGILTPIITFLVLLAIKKLNPSEEIQQAVSEAEHEITRKVLGEIRNGVKDRLDNIDTTVNGEDAIVNKEARGEMAPTPTVILTPGPDKGTINATVIDPAKDAKTFAEAAAEEKKSQ